MPLAFLATADYDPVVSALTASVTTTELATVLAAGVSGAIGLVLLWWAARKVVGMIMRAFRRGKLRL